jgi:thiol-disulfide isomerase/thioredoxin
MLSIKKIFVSALMLIMVLQSSAQDEVTLHIGDKAPDIKYSEWIKGSPIKSFKGDELYVLEFWATWCGPCKAAMPHLTKTQKEYEGKITIIGVDVWEKTKEGENYETALPLVNKFVKGNDANMGYSVVADNNEKHMATKWLTAAGINGIPSTFIIKNKKIIWIGHPIVLDSMLALIENGKYNMEEYKLAYEKKSEASRKQIAAMREGSKKVQDALDAKDYKKAFELMEEVKVEVPILKISMDNLKFTTLLKHVSEKEAIAFAEQWQKDFKSAPQYVLMAVKEIDGLSKSTYLWALKNFESTNKSTVNPMTYNLIASVYAKAGDYQNAITNQEKAIEAAKTALKEGKMIGSIMDYTVTEYETTLGDYKKGEKIAKSE